MPKKQKIGVKMDALETCKCEYPNLLWSPRKEVTHVNEKEAKTVLTPQDVARILRISRNKAYEVVRSKGFPCFKIGKQYRVEREKFYAWLETVQEVA